MAQGQERPLSGLRVVDSADEKGEFCGRILADLGADVVRVEPPGGARSRRLPPFAPGSDESLYFALRNAGKRGVTVDLDAASGVAALHRLLAAADVWIESEAPRALAERGLAHADVLARYPRLVLTSITDFGQTGPYRHYQGTDMLGWAMGGLLFKCGRADKPPVMPPGSLSYDSVGLVAGFATLAAVYKRFQTGRGQHLDVSVYETMASMADWGLPNFSATQGVQARDGAGIYTLYRCADGFVRLILLVTHHWKALLEWMGNPPELADPDLDQFLNRLVRRPEIDPVIERFFSSQKKIDVAVEAQRRGIPVTPLLEPSEVLENEHTRARGTFVQREIAPGIQAPIPSGFAQIDGERLGPRSRAPRPGEHNDEGFAAGSGPRAPATAGNAQSGAHPFQGLRVLDFGVGGVGVEVGRFFAEYGADVIKIESRVHPDFMRAITPAWVNPSFASSSRSKRSFGVNLKTSLGIGLVHALAEVSDVVIDNNGAGVMDKLGLGYEALRKLNPRISVFTSQIVGGQGPWAGWIGYGPNTHPVSGLHHLWNYPEDELQPAGSVNIFPDHLVGRLGALLSAAALIQRERTGRGCKADAAQFEAPIQFLGDLFAHEALAPGSVRPAGNRSQRGVPWGVYRCAGDDEWCAVNVRTDAEWDALCTALGECDWARDPAYRTLDGRRAAQDTIDEQLQAWTSQRSSEDVMKTLQSVGVPAGQVQNAGDQLGDPHLAARGFGRLVDQPGVGAVVFEGASFLGSDLPETIVSPAPLLAEHTREVARELLGLDDEEIERLIAEGVLEDPAPLQP